MMISSIFIVLVIGLLNPTESALQCYFCEIGDPDCTAEDWGKEIGCSSDPGNINYGDACMVEHIVKIDGSGNPTIHEWQRKCVSKSEFKLGCEKEGGDGPGSSEARCVCDEPLCNGRLNESTIPTPGVPVLRCVSCDENDPGCDATAINERVVDCQMDHDDQPNYGNACSVGHTIENGTEQPSKWRRGCKYESVVNYGCREHDFGINGKVLIVDECVCDTDECNREMGTIETSTKQTTTKKENELKCYFCLSDDHNYGDCNDDHAGEIVTCQFENSEGEHYGRTCAVGHTVNSDENIWRRDCYTPEDGWVGCKNDNRSNGTMHWDIQICVCEGELCNEKMGDISSSSTQSTTTHEGSGLECYYCGHDHEEECNNDIAGEKVMCQTENEEKEHYGNTCYVGHDVGIIGKEEHWWRGCKLLPEDSEVGCSEHKFEHDGQEYLVDECVCDHDLCNKEMQPIPETTTKGNGLECFFCLSDDHNLGDCNAEHAGSLVSCSDNPESTHYGNKCSVGHTVTEEDEIWRRDCFHSEDSYVGCRGDQRDNGTVKWDIEYCVCDDENGCNEKMGDIPTSSTPSTTTHIGTDLMCYYCRSTAGECNKDEIGDLIKCQDDNEHAEHFGNACIIGHTVELEETYWGRDCVDSSKLDVGCKQDMFNGTEIQVCVCKEEGCNKEMGEISTSSTASTTTHEGTGISCYYCGYHETCSADEPGEVVKCQMEDPKDRNFGDSCEVAHSVHNDSSEDFWWRGCKPRHDEPLICSEHKSQYHDRDVYFDECLCDTDLCNKEMAPLVTTTPDPSSLECYYCFGHAGTQHDNCDVDVFGDMVTCQMHDRQLPNYGDVCYVGHTEKGDEAGSMTWRRGCEVRGSKHYGCEEYKWQGGNVTVMECLCDSKLCNKDVPEPSSTTTHSTTTGNGLKCYSCGHEHSEDEDCSVTTYGVSVTCQMNDPENPNYGDACYVGHSVHENVTEEHWWRGCKYAYDEPTECTQHSFFHHDHNVTVDECVCRGDMCNKDMLPVIVTTKIPSNKSSPKNVADLRLGLLLSVFAILSTIF